MESEHNCNNTESIMAKPKMSLVIGVGKGKGGPAMDEEAKEGAFKLPEGYDTGDMKEGDEFEAVCTLRIEPDGHACVTKVEGMDVPGYDDKEEQAEGEDHPEKGGFVNAVFGKGGEGEGSGAGMDDGEEGA